MSKVHYLNSHLEKFREEKRITIDVENIGGLAQYGNMGGEDKKPPRYLQNVSTIKKPIKSY